jgi:hypothetical protein
VETFRCNICQKKIESEEIPPGWRQVLYADGDCFEYCPKHTLIEMLNDILFEADFEIGVRCEIEELRGSWQHETN